MDYEGPTADDLDNVRALNRRFLELYAGNGSAGCGGLGRRRLREAELERLSAAPFLLFSFREEDAGLWGRLLGEAPQLELAPAGMPGDGRVRELTVTALGFLWQLAHRNAFAARVVSGAPATWCRQLSQVTLVTLVRRVAERDDLLVPRFHQQDDIWRRLLGGGVSSKRQLQLMSHQSAMQNMLTRRAPERAERLPAAACAVRRPESRVADSPRKNRKDPQV